MATHHATVTGPVERTRYTCSCGDYFIGCQSRARHMWEQHVVHENKERKYDAPLRQLIHFGKRPRR